MFLCFRLVGAPVQIAQLEDDPVLATDPQRNNDFSFDQVCLSHLCATRLFNELGSNRTLECSDNGGMPLLRTRPQDEPA